MKKRNLDEPASLPGLIVYIMGILIVMFIPTWIFLAVKMLVEPTGFWQNITLFGIGAYFLSGIQIIMFVIGVYVIYDIWTAFRQVRRRNRELAESR